MDGIIVINKPKGCTSHDVVAKVKKILNVKKAGHTGTLDPLATGVLPILLGNYTKLSKYLMEHDKTYKATIFLGEKRSTGDEEGEIIQTSEIIPDSEENVKEVLISFLGKQMQVPPIYSAIKVNGKKLYEYARAGETVERPKRQVTISKFELLSSKYDEKNKQQRIRFNVECSKGTYIRTLVVDLARKLGYPGVMSLLTRLKSGGFTLDQTLSLDDVRDAVATQTLQQYLYPLDYALKDYPQLTIQVAQWKKVQNGGWLSPSELNTSEKEIVLSFDGQVKALYHFDPKNKMYKPTKMFAVN